MKGFKPFPFLGIVLLLCVVFTGCGGGAPKSGAPALIITSTTLSQGVINIAYTQALTATGGVPPYTWSVSSGSLPSGMTLSSSGVITGTTSVAKTYSFGVQVTDTQTPTQAIAKAGLSIIINPTLAISTTSLPQATLNLPYTGTVTSTGGLAPIAFSLVSGSSLPPGLSMDSSGNITGAPTSAGSFSFTVQASDAAMETATATLTITVVGLLQGSNSFTLNGFNGNQPFYTVASFAGDGNGNITSGVLDQNGTDSVGPLVAAPITSGTYAVNPKTGPCSAPSGTTGSGSLGAMTLNITTPGGALTYDYCLSFSIDGSVRVILADANHPQAWGSGQIMAQNLTNLSLGSLAGYYSYGFVGNDTAGQRYAGAGMFNLPANGMNAVGAEDNNDNGTVQGNLTTSVSILTGPDPNTGRGTMTLTVNSDVRHYTYYVVNPLTALTAVQTDTGTPISLVSLLKQFPDTIGGGGSATNIDLKGPAVMELNAICPTCSGGPLADESLGVATFDGLGNIVGPSGAPGYYVDENQGGTATNQSCTGGTYSVASNGRVTVQQTGCAGSPSLPPPSVVWYLVSFNQGFVIGTDAGVTAGTFELQTGGPFTNNALLPGLCEGGTVNPVLPGVIDELQSLATYSNGVWQVVYLDGGPNVTLPPMQTDLNIGWLLDPTYGANLGKYTMGIVIGTPPNQQPVETQLAYMVTATPANNGGGTSSNQKMVVLQLLNKPPANPTAAPPPITNPNLISLEH